MNFQQCCHRHALEVTTLSRSEGNTKHRILEQTPQKSQITHDTRAVAYKTSETACSCIEKKFNINESYTAVLHCHQVNCKCAHITKGQVMIVPRKHGLIRG